MIIPDLSKPEWRAQKTYDAEPPRQRAQGHASPAHARGRGPAVRQVLYEEIPQPDPAHYAAMEMPIDPHGAFGPEEINRLLDVEGLRNGVEIGWCNLPNGAGYIANTIFYPDVTADMIDWWFVWHPLEDLRYRIWYPPQHAGIMLSPIDRARILDPGIPNREKNWGVTHYVTENCDCGMDNVDISFRSPADMGFDMEHVRQGERPPSRAERAGRCRSTRATAPSPRRPSCATCSTTSPAACVHRTRFWMGYRFTEAGQAGTMPAAGCIGAGRGRSGPGAPQRQGVHALSRLPAADIQRTRREPVLLEQPRL